MRGGAVGGPNSEDGVTRVKVEGNRYHTCVKNPFIINTCVALILKG